MIELITEIIQKFGPRPAASQAEKNAQLFIRAKCLEITDKAEVLTFQGYMNARFGKLKYYVIIFIAAQVLYDNLPILGLVISLLNGFFIIFDLMMFRNVMTKFPGRKEYSSNVEATLEPKGEVKSTLIVSGHMDSTLEYTWWYKLGAIGVILTIVTGIIMVLQPIFLIWHFIAPAPYHFFIWLGFTVLTPVTIVYWDMHGEEAVPGAQDNLSGIAIAFEVFKSLADKDSKGSSVLNNTRIKFVSFGSEERGLCGSRAYVKQRKDVLKNENAHLLNIDGVRQVKEIAVVRKELMNGTTHTPALVNGLMQTFEELRYPHKSVAIPMGGTDGVSFARAGLPSVTIIGMSTKAYDFTYHTRNDLVEHIEPEALDNVKNTLVAFIKKWDVTS